MTKDSFLTTKEVSDIIKVKVATVQKWCREGKLKSVDGKVVPIKFPSTQSNHERRKWRIPRIIIDEYLYFRGKPPW